MHRKRQSHSSTNGGNNLSNLAKGTGLLDGGVEIECIPDHRYNCSLSGKKFINTSSSYEGKSAKIFKPYSLALPKTYVTRRGKMVLFTAPEDMVVGRSLSFHEREIQMEHVKSAAVKEFKTTSELKTSAINYEDSGISDGEGETAVRPGCFTSTYLDNLKSHVYAERSVQVTDEEEEAEVITTNLSPDLPVTESDSGIDSSVSHQTLTTSGRLSSLSHHSESTLNIIIPDGTSDEKTPKHERSPYQVRFNDEVFIQESQSTLHSAAEKIIDKRNAEDIGHSVASQELSDIIASLPKTKPQNVPSSSKKKGQKKKGQTRGKKEPEKKKSGKEVPVSSVPSTKKKPRIRKKAKKQKEMADSSQGCLPIDNKPDKIQREDSKENDGNEQEVSTAEQRRREHLAKADERRKIAERKRLEKLALENEKRQEEQRQALLAEQLQSIQNGNSTIMHEYSSSTGIEPSTDERPEAYAHLHPLIMDNMEYVEDIQLTESERSVQDALQRSRELRERRRVEEMRKHEEDTKVKVLEKQQKEAQKTRKEADKSGRTSLMEDAHKLQGKEELNYKMQLELLTQRNNQRLTPSYYFSYFEFMPNKKTNDKDKKRSKNSVRRK